MLRTPETGRIGRDTPDLYSVYSVVFSSHLHTNSASQPYCRKGFQICIQCIQRIPTPFVFRFSLLLGREYTHTCPLAMPSHRHAEPRMHRTPPPVSKGVNRRENGPLAHEHAVSYIATDPDGIALLRSDYPSFSESMPCRARMTIARRASATSDGPRDRRICIQRGRRIRVAARAERARIGGIRPASAATRACCMHCIQLYSDAECIQIRPVSPTAVRVSDFVFSVFSVFRPLPFSPFLSF